MRREDIKYASLSLVAVAIELGCVTKPSTQQPRPSEEQAQRTAVFADWSKVPRLETTPSRPEEVCAGDFHSCARAGSAVACWGENSWHQVAPTDEPQVEVPRVVTAFAPARSLRCSRQGTCILTLQGDVQCIGGGASISDHVALPAPAKELTLHEFGACAILRDSRVFCWSRMESPVEVTAANGASGFALAGLDPNTVCTLQGKAAPVCIVFSGSAPEVKTVVAEELFGADQLLLPTSVDSPLCAWFKDGHVRCRNSGLPNRVMLANPPNIPADAAADELVASSGHGYCSRDRSKKLHCVGELEPVVQRVPSDAETLAFGYLHTCAIANGQIRCWGAAAYGQLGAAGTYLHQQPLLVPGVENAIELHATTDHVCALREGGKLSCWGQWSPDGSSRVTVHYAPLEITAPGPALQLNFDAVTPVANRRTEEHSVCARFAAGFRCLTNRDWTTREAAMSPLPSLGGRPRRFAPDLQCGITAGDQLICAGDWSTAGQRKILTRLLRIDSNERFREVTSVLRVMSSAGETRSRSEYVCALTVSQRVKCFRLESGTEETLANSRSLDGLGNVVQVKAASSADAALACALTVGGEVWCWGDARYGQLGDKVTRDFFEPVRINGLPPIAEIAVGGNFACARSQQGQVYCWGSNRDGAVPDGQTGENRDAISVIWPL